MVLVWIELGSREVERNVYISTYWGYMADIYPHAKKCQKLIIPTEELFLMPRKELHVRS